MPVFPIVELLIDCLCFDDLGFMLYMFLEDFANAGFWNFEPYDGPLRQILALIGRIWSKNGSPRWPQKWSKKSSRTALKNDPKNQPKNDPILVPKTGPNMNQNRDDGARANLAGGFSEALKMG